MIPRVDDRRIIRRWVVVYKDVEIVRKWNYYVSPSYVCKVLEGMGEIDVVYFVVYNDGTTRTYEHNYGEV